MHSIQHNYTFIIIIIIIIILATGFGLKRPTSGQYLQQKKPKNAGAYSLKNSPAFLRFFVNIGLTVF
jgi:hypothetical protein